MLERQRKAADHQGGGENDPLGQPSQAHCQVLARMVFASGGGDAKDIAFHQDRKPDHHHRDGDRQPKRGPPQTSSRTLARNAHEYERRSDP